MESLEITCQDLECGDDRCSSPMSDNDKEKLSCSEDNEGSSYSLSYSKPDGFDFYYKIEEVLDSERVLPVVNSDCSVDIESGVPEFNVLLGLMERDCRICHLSLRVGGSEMESGIAIRLGWVFL
ncbi:uncharacterized protein LOC141691517 [Apium graveolens]|uniref:uncharacterized protein LOC141691517 n=1 Tax=Apium graveolens TaxID=4045 RepID=UPI003D7A47A4